MVLGPGRLRRAGARARCVEGRRHRRARPPARARRHRRQLRRRALRLRPSGAGGRHQLRGRGHGRVRHRRDRAQPRARPMRATCSLPASSGLFPRARTSAASLRRSCAHARWARCSASCRAAARCWPSSPPTRSRRGFAAQCRVRQGAIEGVAAPESANNAGAQTSFVPMLTLGVPSNPVMALMIGALHGAWRPARPDVMAEQPTLFWGVIVSMWVGNLFLLVLNLPLIGLWVRLLTLPLPPALSGHPRVLRGRACSASPTRPSTST